MNDTQVGNSNAAVARAESAGSDVMFRRSYDGQPWRDFLGMQDALAVAPRSKFPINGE